MPNIERKFTLNYILGGGGGELSWIKVKQL